MGSAERPVTTDDTAALTSAVLGAAQFARAVNEKIHELEGDWVGGEYDFVCECDDQNCTTVIRITTSDYQVLRENPGLCAVLPGHEQPTDEVVGRGKHHLFARRPGVDGAESPKRPA